MKRKLGIMAKSGAISRVLSAERGAPLQASEERKRIFDSFQVLNVPAELKVDVIEALDSDQWDWFVDCDGCTCVSETYWPTLYFPPCLRHDFDCIRGLGGLDAQRRFYRLNVAYGMSPLRAAIRVAGVSVAWYAWMRWRKYPLSPRSVQAVKACNKRFGYK